MTITPVTLVNADAELGNTTGWTHRGGGTMGVLTGGHTGTYRFVATPNGASARWDQQAAVDPALWADVDAGLIRAKATAWYWTFDDDSGALYVEAIASDGTTILDRDQNSQSSPGSWTDTFSIVRLPPGTRYVRIGTSNLRDAGTELSVYWDDFALELSDTPYGPDGDIRVNFVELNYGYYQLSSSIRCNFAGFSYGHYPTTKPFVRVNFITLQVGYYPQVKPFLRICHVNLQYAVRAPETTMSNDVFPGSANSSGSSQGRPMLKGMTYNNKARPMFSTKVAKHTSGKETATSYWENPKWQFELAFEWLPNKPGVNEDFRTLCGFFMSRRGRFDTFLYRNFDDYLVTDLQVGIGDGILTEWELFRTYGGFRELIGQIDTENLDVWLRGPSNHPIDPVTYDLTLHIDTDDITSVVVDGDTITDVSPAMPASANQYNRTGDVMTFHSSRGGDVAVITARVLQTVDTDYTVLMPRTLVFVDAPDEDIEIIASFQFFFACRFVEDYQEYEQFADRLWELQEMTIESIIQ